MALAENQWSQFRTYLEQVISNNPEYRSARTWQASLDIRDIPSSTLVTAANKELADGELVEGDLEGLTPSELGFLASAPLANSCRRLNNGTLDWFG